MATHIEISSANIIKKFWKKYSYINELTNIKKMLEKHLNKDLLQDFSNKCNAITNACKGDGAGLSGGCLIDMFICEFFNKYVPNYQNYHKGEADMKINDIKLSQKKINGKSTIALDWSKNETDNDREQFESDMLIINLKTQKWWKSNPKNITNTNIIYNKTIPAGFYIIPKQYCKKYIKLSSNNKTNSLIDSVNLYTILHRSLLQELFIEIPVFNKNLKFNILKSFTE